MGVGKTTVSRLVAADLGRPVRDCDEDVRASTGMSAADYARQHGIDALHEQEAEVLLDALAETSPLVVTAAASTIEVAACRRALDCAFVVWLCADPAVLAGRAATSAHRPLDDDAVAQLQRQSAERAELFAGVADCTLEVSHRRADEIAVDVMRQLRG